MKANYIAIIAIMMNLSSMGQSKLAPYKVLYSQQTYNDLSGDSILWENEFWVDSMYKSHGWVIPLNQNIQNQTINYSFNKFSYLINSSQLSIRGVDYVLSTIVCNCFTREYSNNPPYQTKVSYKLETVNNKLIFKFQLKNLGISDSLYASKGRLNIQWWFYDGGDIEIRYGESNINPEWLQSKPPDWGRFKPTIGLRQYIDTLQSHNMLLVGEYNNPKIYNGINKPFFDLMHDSSLSSFPPSGTVYRFTTSSVGLTKKTFDDDFLEIYPNPFDNEINIKNKTNEDFEVQIMDELGRNVASYISPIQIDTKHLSQGFYTIIVKDKLGGIINKKLVKVKN